MKSFFKNIFSTILGVIISIIIVVFLFAGFIAVMSSKQEFIIKENSILKIDLENTSVVERRSENPFDKFSLSGEVLKTIGLKQILDKRDQLE